MCPPEKIHVLTELRSGPNYSAVAVCVCVCVCVCVKERAHAPVLSHVRLFVTLWTVACQAPLSMEFPRQKYWSGLPFPPPGDLPDPGTEPAALALAGRFLTTNATWVAPTDHLQMENKGMLCFGNR